MFTIPKGRKKIRVGRLCLLLGLTVLLFLMIAWSFGDSVEAMRAAVAERG